MQNYVVKVFKIKVNQFKPNGNINLAILIILNKILIRIYH